MNMNLAQEIKRNAYDLAYLKGLISNENTDTSWVAIFRANPMRVYKKAPMPYLRYSTNRLGQVKGPSNKILKPHYNNSGYPVIPIVKDNGKGTTITVSRLVALTWIPNPHKLSDVDHMNGDLDDNCIDNLRWLSHANNLRRREHKSGNRPVIGIDLLSGKKYHYKSMKEAALVCNLSYSTVRGLCTHRYTLPAANFLTFRFEEK
ncbi:hypothetical protein QYI97_01705 [Lacticaseibacillus paracasei]|uniref:HNH endonuclease n=1 Tax=Lacticaseibacillus paracasei TaxID=1597 RepID=UPI00260B7F90|nr:hypothetical protein [Lacticaseibacillus paracasei]MDN4552953.1 hypothetical protein [Lacticaseibacillus paracasei]